MFIINAPFVFRSAYSIASPFIHPVTKEKIKARGGGGDERARLEERSRAVGG